MIRLRVIEDNGHISFMYYFKYEKGPEIVFTFESPLDGSTQQWESLLDAVKNSTSYNLELNVFGGFIGISTHGGKTSFDIGGQKGDSVSCIFENSECLQVFEDSLNTIKKYSVK